MALGVDTINVTCIWQTHTHTNWHQQFQFIYIIKCHMNVTMHNNLPANHRVCVCPFLPKTNVISCSFVWSSRKYGLSVRKQIRRVHIILAHAKCAQHWKMIMFFENIDEMAMHKHKHQNLILGCIQSGRAKSMNQKHIVENTIAHSYSNSYSYINYCAEYLRFTAACTDFWADIKPPNLA